MRLAVDAADTFWPNDRGAVVEAVAGAFGESCDDAHAGLTRDGEPQPDAGAVYRFGSRFDLVARTEVVRDGTKLRQDRQPRTRCGGPPEKTRAVLPGEDLQPEGTQTLGGRARVPYQHTNVMQAMDFRGDCAGHSSTQAATRAGPPLPFLTGTGMASRVK